MYLLDTNALLFFLYDSEKLSKKASEVIYRNDEKINVSIASMWEIAIKSSIGKLGNWKSKVQFLKLRKLVKWSN